jgi:pimeloyl-ACP methyl ester carboxylesterase
MIREVTGRDAQGCDVTWRVRDEGTGPVLLLVHGFPLDHQMWTHQFTDLSRDFRLIAPDLRGFGGSSPVEGELTLPLLADDLAVILDRLAVTEPVAYVGLSMGGYVGWQFWARHADRVRALAMCDTRAAADSAMAAEARRRLADRVLAEGVPVLTEEMLPRLFAPSSTRDRSEDVRRTLEVMNGTSPRTIAAAQRAMAARPDMTEALAGITVPVLALCGEEDRITPTEEMRAMAERIPGASFSEIPAAGHMAPLENPAAVNEALRAFLG